MKKFCALFLFFLFQIFGTAFPAFADLKGTYDCFGPQHQHYSPLHGCVWIETRLLHNLFMFGPGVQLEGESDGLKYTLDKERSDHTTQLIHELFSLRPGDLDILFISEEIERKITYFFSPGVIAHFLYFMDQKAQEFEQHIEKLTAKKKKKKKNNVLDKYIVEFLGLIESEIPEEKKVFYKQTLDNTPGTDGRTRFNHLRRIMKHFILAQHECLPLQPDTGMIRYLPHTPYCVLLALLYQKSRYLDQAHCREIIDAYLTTLLSLLRNQLVAPTLSKKDLFDFLQQNLRDRKQLQAEIKELIKERHEASFQVPVDWDLQRRLSKKWFLLHERRKNLANSWENANEAIRKRTVDISKIEPAKFGQKDLRKIHSVKNDPEYREVDYASLVYTLLLENIYQRMLPVPVTYKGGITARGQQFTDCFGTAFRNFVDVLIYNLNTFTFNPESLPARSVGKPWHIFHPLLEFYHAYPLPAQANKLMAHNAWAETVSGLNNIDYEKTDVEINSTEANFVNLWNILFLAYEQLPEDAPRSIFDVCQQLQLSCILHKNIFYDKSYIIGFPEDRSLELLIKQGKHTQVNFMPDHEQRPEYLSFFNSCLEQSTSLQSCNLAVCTAPTIGLADIVDTFEALPIPSPLITSCICTKHLHHPACLLSVVQTLLTRIPHLQKQNLKGHLRTLALRFTERLYTIENIYQRPFYKAEIIKQLIDMDASTVLPEFYGRFVEQESDPNVVVSVLFHIFTTHVASTDLTTGVTTLQQPFENPSVRTIWEQYFPNLVPRGKTRFLISIIESLINLKGTLGTGTLIEVVQQMVTIHSIDLETLLQLPEQAYDIQSTIDGIIFILDNRLYNDADDSVTEFVNNLFAALAHNLNLKIDIEKSVLYKLFFDIVENDEILDTKSNADKKIQLIVYPSMLRHLNSEIKSTRDLAMRKKLSKVLYKLIKKLTAKHVQAMPPELTNAIRKSLPQFQTQHRQEFVKKHPSFALITQTERIQKKRTLNKSLKSLINQRNRQALQNALRKMTKQSDYSVISNAIIKLFLKTLIEVKQFEILTFFIKRAQKDYSEEQKQLIKSITEELLATLRPESHTINKIQDALSLLE